MDLLLLPPAGPIRTAPPAALWLPGRLLLPAAKATVAFRKARLFPRFANNARTTFFARASSSSMSPPSEAPAPAPASPPDTPPCTRWVVVMQKPPIDGSSKSEVIDYYVRTLARVLGSEKEAQMSIYDASWQSNFGFCCDIEEEPSRELARVPGVLLVRPDKDPEFEKKDYSYSNVLLGHQTKSDAPASRVSPSGGDFEYWIVRMEKPGVQVITKAQMVDYYAQTLTKVLGNEKDAQVSIYNISWEKDFGFCCQIDEECAQDLADVPGVLSVRPDMNFESENKNYKGDGLLHNTKDISDSSETSQTLEVRTKRLFVTGLSFYTSEKTLRAAFEGFGELVEVKIIMDKISKRSKGYAFIEYTAEEAASRALKEMNGKIINGWMIVVDVAKTNPPKYSRRSPRPLSSSSSVLS